MKKTTLLALPFALAACGGEKAPDAATAAPPVAAANPDDFRKAQKAYADSVLNATGSAKEIAKKLGDQYDVGSTRLRDSVAILATKADCLKEGRNADPYLAGTVTIMVNMGVIGSDIIRVQESSWSSAAGQRVDGCLNLAAPKWKFDSSFGAPKSYLVQVQFKPAE